MTKKQEVISRLRWSIENMKYLRIPITVVDDACIRSREVDSHPAGPRREQEDEARRLSVEPVYGFLPLVARRASVKPLVTVASQAQKLLYHIQHANELAEDKHL